MSGEQGRSRTLGVDYDGPKNDEDCDACKAHPDGICDYHYGYDDGFITAMGMLSDDASEVAR